MKQKPRRQRYTYLVKPVKLAKGKRVAKKRKSVRRKNVTRARREWLRAYGSEDRVLFVQNLDCIACVNLFGLIMRPSQNAHSVGGGAGRKADADTIVPLCSHHHRKLHHVGAREFQETYSLDFEQAAKAVAAAWTRYQERAA